MDCSRFLESTGTAIPRPTDLLDQRLVYVFDPSKRNIENLNYGMYVKNPLTNGDGTMRSEDPDSMAVVFDDVNKNVYCGEGYVNLDPISTYQIIKEYLGNSTYKITFNDTGLSNFFGYERAIVTDDGNPLSSSFILVEKSNTNSKITFWGVSSTNEDLDFGYNSKTLYQETGGSKYLGIGIYDCVDGDYFIYKELSITDTDVVVPFVKYTAPDGKLIIKEPWTSVTHSFIGVGFKKEIDSIPGFYQTFKGGGITEERVSGGSIDFNLKYDALTSSLFLKFIDENNVETTPILFDAGISGGIIDVCRTTRSNTNKDFKSSQIEGFFVYEGNLTEQELRDELAKIKSGKYYIENTGVYEPVPKAQRRRDEFGNYKEGVFIENQSTDIQLVETNKRVTTTDYLGNIRTDNIDASGVITGDGGIEDISGYIRLTALTGVSPTQQCKIEVEKL